MTTDRPFRLDVRLSAEENRLLEQAAAKLGDSRSNIARRALIRGLTKCLEDHFRAEMYLDRLGDDDD